MLKYKKLDDNKVMTVVNSIDNMWPTRYPQPEEIMYACAPDFIGSQFKNTDTYST